MSQGSADDSVADWVPAVDVVEEKDRYVLRADLPGVQPADIDLSMDAGTLSISGSREAAPMPENSGFQRLERANGRFFRRFSLPETADADSISARSDNGILEVSIPKQAVVQARRITVESA
jgi:HSP20 family protein